MNKCELLGRELTKQDIYDGVERNIICYDSKAEPGLLTEKLLLIMKDVAFNNQNFDEYYTKYHFWVGSIGEITPDLWLRRIVNPDGTTTEVEEREVTVDERLLPDGELFNYFRELDACLASLKKALVVMVCNNGQILLGSY